MADKVLYEGNGWVLKADEDDKIPAETVLKVASELEREKARAKSETESIFSLIFAFFGVLWMLLVVIEMFL